MHILEQKVVAVRRRVLGLLIVYSVARALAVLLSVGLLLSLADYCFRFQDLGVRIICFLTLLGVCGWAAYRELWLGLRRRLSDVEIARRIERRFPQLSDRLASAVEFLQQSEQDQSAGSSELRRAVIAQTSTDIESLNVSEVVQPRPAMRAAVVATGIIAVIVVLAALEPSSVPLAAQRLLNPFGDAAWPRNNYLAFKNPPQRLAAGQPFEVELIDENGRLPQDVTIYYKYRDANGESSEETGKMQFLNGAMITRKESVSRPFCYRAEGGDDDSMDWIELEVVEPPRVETVRITLHPPDYTGWPMRHSDKRIRVLRGTRVEMVGTSTKELAAATLRFDKAPPLAARLTDHGYGFVISTDPKSPWVINESDNYSFELNDKEGLNGGADTLWEIRAVPDQAPSLSVEQPASNLFLTADAVVPVRVSVRDDLAIHEIELRGTRSDQTEVGEFVVTLYSGPTKVEAFPPGTPAAVLEAGETRVVETQWDLGPLKLDPKTQLTVYGAARDYLPQQGQSMPRQITIITAAELEDRLAQRQEFILGELARVLKMQQAARAQTAALMIQLNEVGQLGKQDINYLQSAELNQRQVARSLASSSEGVATLITSLLAELESNRVDSPDIERRMQSLLDEIERLNKDYLPVIEAELTSALKGAQAGAVKHGTGSSSTQSSADAEVTQPLTSAGKSQDHVIESLERLLGDLAQWDNYRRFGRDMRQIKSDQEELQKETEAVGSKTVGKELNDLDSQQVADLKKISQRQRDLGRRFEKVQQQMESIIGTLRQSDQIAAETISDALHAARQRAISGQIRQSGEHVERNQIGQAGERQKRVTQDLQEVLDILANRREQELARLVKQLREAESQLSALRREQLGLQKSLAENAVKTDGEKKRQELQRLVRRQRQLKEEAERMARRLERLQADKAAHSTKSAAGKMGQGSDTGQSGDGGQCADCAVGARKDLDEAQEQLAERRRQAEMDLAQEELVRTEDALRGLLARQEKVIEETLRLDGIVREQGRLTRAQAQGVYEVAREQEYLQKDLSELGNKIAAAQVFRIGLEAAGADMGQAVKLLDERKTDATTQQTETAARDKLSQMLEALKPDGEKQSSSSDRGQGGGSGGGQGGSRNIASVAELRLLKLMQQDINRRTHALNENSQGQDRKLEQQQEYEGISQQQGQLAELVLRLSEPAELESQDNSEELPGLQEDDVNKAPVTPNHAPLKTDHEKTEKSLDEELLKGLGLPEGLDEPNTKNVNKNRDQATRDPDEQLLKGLGDGEDIGPDSEQDPLVRIGARMRVSERLIRSGQTAERTQKLQNQIITNIDELIELAKKNRQSSRSFGKPGGSARSGNKPGGNPSESSTGSAEAQQARNSSDRLGNAQSRRADTEQTKELIKKSWGDLPVHLREQLLQNSPEKFLPKYELLIEEYFKRLVEEPADK